MHQRRPGERRQSLRRDRQIDRAERRKEIIRKRRRAYAVMALLACLLAAAIAVPHFFNPQQTENTIAPAVEKRAEPEKKIDSTPSEAPRKPNSDTAVADRDGRKVNKSEIVFIGLGDMLFDRQVAAMIKKKGASELFSDVAGILRAADIVAGNLECPLSTRGEPVKGKDVTFRGVPEAAQGMKDAGINVVSLANNHILDYDPDALSDTIDLLDKSGIAYAGAGNDIKQAFRSTIIDKKGNKVAFLAYSSILPDGFWATSTRPGIAGTRPDWKLVENGISEAAEKSDYVIASFHWGVEYQDYPQEYQREFARKAIDSGADIVLGHHPHVIQGIEIYKGKLIAYSMGGFVFDHYSRKTGETFILKASLRGGSISGIEIIPVYMTSSGKPEIVTGEEASSILKRLQEISSPFKTKIEITEDRAAISL